MSIDQKRKQCKGMHCCVYTLTRVGSGGSGFSGKSGKHVSKRAKSLWSLKLKLTCWYNNQFAFKVLMARPSTLRHFCCQPSEPSREEPRNNPARGKHTHLICICLCICTCICICLTLLVCRWEKRIHSVWSKWESWWSIDWDFFIKMLESRPEDALVKLVLTVVTVFTVLTVVTVLAVLTVWL